MIKFYCCCSARIFRFYGPGVIAVAAVWTAAADAATVSFSRSTSTPSAAAIAAGVPFDYIYNSYFVTTDADIISLNEVRDRLNKSASPFQIASPQGSDTEGPPTPEKLLENIGVEADSWITTPGPTQRMVAGDQGSFPGGDTWFDATDDGPQTNFQFAFYSIPIEVNGFLEGSITLASPTGPQTIPFSLFINFPFPIPEPGTWALASFAAVALVAIRRWKR